MEHASAVVVTYCTPKIRRGYFHSAIIGYIRLPVVVLMSISAWHSHVEVIPSGFTSLPMGSMAYTRKPSDKRFVLINRSAGYHQGGSN